MALSASLSPAATRWEREVTFGPVFLAVPMYGGVCHHGFAMGLMDTATLFQSHGIPLAAAVIVNESLIQRARNKLVAMFLASGAEHLVFIDADIGFTGEAVMRLLAHDRDIMCGAYRKKNAEKVDFALNFPEIAPGKVRVERDRQTGAIRVRHAATGFLAIKRRVIQAMYDARPDLHFELYGAERRNEPWEERLHLWFDCYIDPRTRAYLSEDYAFCERAAELGFDCWMDPGLILEHHGTTCFSADPMEHFAALMPRPGDRGETLRIDDQPDLTEAEILAAMGPSLQAATVA